MFIVYVDTDAAMHERMTDTFRQTHRVLSFAELFEAYKWIKHNDIPDVIVTEMDVDASTGLQSLRFLQSKAKLKQTHLVGFTHQPGNYTDLLLSEGAAALFAKANLIDELSAYLQFISAARPKAKTLRDVEEARGRKPVAKATRKQTN